MVVAAVDGGLAIRQELDQCTGLCGQPLPRLVVQPVEGRRFDAFLDRAPHTGDVAVDEQSWQDVTVAPEDHRAVLRRDDAAAIGVREQDAVPHRQQPRWRDRVLVWKRRRGHVEQRRPARALQLFDLVAQG